MSKGTLDGGHGVLVYHYGKQKCPGAVGIESAFGMDANMMLSRHKYGGGKALLEKVFKSIGANVVSFPYTDRCRRNRLAGSRSRSPKWLT